MASPIDFSFMAGPQNPTDMGSATNLTAMGGLQKILSDPNIWRMLAEQGSNISQGQNLGQALGDPATQAFRRKAFQEAAAKSSGQQGDVMKQLIAALQGEGDITNLVGPKEDFDTADSISVTDGGINVKLPTKKKPAERVPLTDQPLEAITGEAAGGGTTAPVSDARTRDDFGELPFF